MDEPKRILIVDDVEQNRELLESIVTSLGHESETAEDGVEALANVTFIDLSMDFNFGQILGNHKQPRCVETGGYRLARLYTPVQNLAIDR